MKMQFSHQVIDEFGDVARKFYSLREAKWYIENKPGCKLEKLYVKRESNYQYALQTFGECLF